MEYKDFYELIDNNNDISGLVERYNADKSLNYFTEDGIIKIKKSTKPQLDKILNYTIETNIEVAFGALFDEEQNCIVEFISGDIGNSDYCDWFSDNFLDIIIEKSKDKNLKVLLSHTHPCWEDKKYGAICSKIFYSGELIKDSINDNNKEMFDRFLKDKSYLKYGGDYLEQNYLSLKYENVSDLFLISSPKINQIGIFRVGDNGDIYYRRWEFID